MTILHPVSTNPWALTAYLPICAINSCQEATLHHPYSYPVLYYTQVQRPHFIKDITKLEKIQKRATKYIHNDYTSDYKSSLMTLKILSLMGKYELFNIIFCVMNLKSSASHFDIKNFISFSKNATRSATYTQKNAIIVHHLHSSLFPYFNRLPRLWNTISQIDLEKSSAIIREKVRERLWNHFLNTFDPSSLCTYHLLCPCASCSQHPSYHNFFKFLSNLI